MTVVLAVGMSVLLVASIWMAFFGPPPRSRASPGTIKALSGLGITAYASGVLLAERSVTAAGVAMALGVVGLCAAGWLRRGGGGGGGGPGRDPGSEPPSHDGPDFDWDDFDRARGEWDAGRREPAGR